MRNTVISARTYLAMFTLFLVNNMFVKRQICLQCRCDLRLNDQRCDKCNDDQLKRVASIYDVDLSFVFTQTLDCLSDQIDIYRNAFLNHSRDELTNDIPYNNNYRMLLATTNQPFISLILHVDGIGLGQSSGEHLWLLSCSLVELPPYLRMRRFNMPVLSVWIAKEAPDMSLWLQDVFQRLHILKEKG
jgi:hypothetical protein